VGVIASTQLCARSAAYSTAWPRSREAINRFVAQANTEPKPFHWAKDPDTIIAAVRRGHQVLDYSG
jgi:hypothetical protein